MSQDVKVRAWQLFERAVELDANERRAWIDQQCEGDANLRRIVERLLACDQRAAQRQFLADSPLAVRFLPDSDDWIGRDLGPYRIEQRIGQGGMGSVYRARRQADFQQTAAVKVVRAGRGDANLVRAFQNEVQLLAKVRQHPRIVGLMDAGMTPDGFAYLVMDYVPGEPLDVYCRQHQLGWRARLQLFLQVCDAVAFAHRQLVTHRDLKPSNILVVEGAEAKLLDFGIAREESFADQQTQTIVRAFTPDYASPEQVRGESLSTLTDVYSLGVILFQLITDQRPYHTAGLSPTELERLITESDPPPLTRTLANSSTTTSLGGDRFRPDTIRDLDAIILKAMAKSPEQRYGTVAELMDDIQRLLRGDAVRARKRTTSYVVRKFVHRHRVLVATVSVVLASLVIAVVGTGLGLRQARREQERTQASLALNRETVREFMDLLDRQQLGRLSGTQASRLALQQVLQNAAETLHRDLAQDESSREQLAAVDLKVGGLLLTLGERSRAMEILQRARKSYEELSTLRPGDDSRRVALGQCWQNIGTIHLARLESADAEAALNKALGQFRPVTTGESADAARFGEAVSLMSLGRRAADQRDIRTATEYYEQAAVLLRELQHRRPDDPKVREKVVSVDSDLSVMALRRADCETGLQIARDGLPDAERLVEQHPLIVDYQVLLGKRLLNLADVLQVLKRSDEALQLYQRADDRWSRIVEQNPDVVSYKSDWSTVLRNASTLCLFDRKLDEAIAYASRLVELRQQIVQLVTDEPKRRDELALAYRSLGEAFDESARYDESLAQFENAEKIHRTMVAQYPTNAEFLGNYGLTLHGHGLALKHAGRQQDAAAVYEQGMRWTREALEKSADYETHWETLINLYLGLLEIQREAKEVSALRKTLEAGAKDFAERKDELATIGVEWAKCASLKSAADEALMPEAAERGRELLVKARSIGANLAELKELPEWPTLRDLPGYAQLVE